MKPLFVLFSTFIISLAILCFTDRVGNIPLAGNIAMSVMLVFTAIGHFVYTKGMEMMMPPFIPFKKAMVYITGLIEIAAAIGLMIHALQSITALLLILFFILLLPCNIYAAMQKVNYQKATYDGPGRSYLWFRIPMQIVLIAWVYVCNFVF